VNLLLHDVKGRLGLNANALKYIAIVAMTVDHVAHAFVPYGSMLYDVMRFVGRITGPIMFFMAAEGYRHTRDIVKYLKRLFAFAFVSWLPFVFFMHGGNLTGLRLDDYVMFSVIHTIFFGVLAMHARHKINNPVLQILAILGCIFISGWGDWGMIGVVIMLVFDFFYGSRKMQALVYSVLVLVLMNFFPFVAGFFTEGYFDSSILEFITAGMFLPMLLLFFYNGKRGGGGAFSKWFFYVYYPAHLAGLGVLCLFL
jgi:hypothetical protein